MDWLGLLRLGWTLVGLVATASALYLLRESYLDEQARRAEDVNGILLFEAENSVSSARNLLIAAGSIATSGLAAYLQIVFDFDVRWLPLVLLISGPLALSYELVSAVFRRRRLIAMLRKRRQDARTR